MIAQVDAGSRERRAAFAHSLVHADVVGIGTAVGKHIAHVGIVGVFRLADGSKGFDVELGSHFELHAQLHAVVFLIDARE